MINGVPDTDIVTIPENTAACEAIDKIESEFIARRVDVQPVEISAKIITQDVELRLAMFLKQRWRFVRMPLEWHDFPLFLALWVSHYARFLRVNAHPISA